ncbi:DUF2600 family protein [Acetivibrio straminisolvens]|uniref:Uncharacterized protein n=1 Tax=Acetivibrio straminisolvens JCM 21531 TaxID=1294263 RepID=W4VA76_9FIRM|nr:DUF2600 family protein [Acetivibrio straminisolvens]GAE90092.1 hypothetical protein JCM21531_3677 [Acetivibrio straminisolvens JCM 21531]
MQQYRRGFPLIHKKTSCPRSRHLCPLSGVNLDNALDFIVSFQAIDCYLNLLCSNIKKKDELLFSRLYLSLRDAVDPKRKISVGYLNCLSNEDITTITKLIEKCRNQVVMLSSYNLVITQLKKFIQIYSDFMAYSHLNKELRDKKIEEWVNRYHDENTGISKGEMLAASASPLLIFVLFACAHDPDLTKEEIDNICAAYFPWICGLHALLRHFVNVNEAMQNYSINLTTYYKNLKMCEERIIFFIEKALESCNSLKYPKFHSTIVKTMVALYLTEPKAYHGMNKLASTNIMKKSGSAARFYYNLCKLLRLSGRL